MGWCGIRRLSVRCGRWLLVNRIIAQVDFSARDFIGLASNRESVAIIRPKV